VAFEERRRGPRVEIAGGPELRLNRRVRVRVLDISSGGALVACDERVPTGTVGRLRVALGSEPFEAAVEIRREEPRSGAPVLLGAVIVSASRGSEDALEQFLRRSQ
jgi:hypothetical protein